MLLQWQACNACKDLIDCWRAHHCLLPLQTSTDFLSCTIQLLVCACCVRHALYLCWLDQGLPVSANGLCTFSSSILCFVCHPAWFQHTAGADLAGKLILRCCQCSKEFHSSCAQICARWEANDGQAIKVSALQVAAWRYSGKCSLMYQSLRVILRSRHACEGVCTANLHHLAFVYRPIGKIIGKYLQAACTT